MENHLHRQRTLDRLGGSSRRGRYGKREGCRSRNLNESLVRLFRLFSAYSLIHLYAVSGMQGRDLLDIVTGKLLRFVIGAVLVTIYRQGVTEKAAWRGWCGHFCGTVSNYILLGLMRF